MANGQSTVTLGPHGGKGGKQWDDGTYNTVKALTIHSEEKLYSIQVVYHDNERKQVSGNRHGAVAGKSSAVILDYPTEYLVSISGYCGSYGPHRVVTAGDRVDSIGLYMKPILTKIPIGPFGTTSGQKWDDVVYSKVSELIVHSGAVIDCIQVVYDNEGKRVLREKHRTVGGQENKVKLDPDEFLISFWGYFEQVGNMVVIRSLGFQSNKRMIGPFGVEDGEKFQFSSSTCAKIIGFYGRSDKYINAIGAYLDN
ncbi:jacalin-related lectin 3-like [Cornus florida]|uniref:jacalin-related lectin 3-like n=1 Tax=Cornus florida TaxID=4283 RepID=UPI00289DE2CE|nr:jacalin-related lectin 3-like [Cornus florida]